MPPIPEKYDRLRLTDLYLADKMLMALAWKKAHDYIRNTNWYADNFELDKSALHLAEHCQAWVNDISSGKLSFEKLKLVPAPKTAHWSFIDNPRPKAIDDALKTPLSEITAVSAHGHLPAYGTAAELIKPVAFACKRTS